MKVFSFQKLINSPSDYSDNAEYIVVGDYRIDNIDELTNKIKVNSNLAIEKILIEGYKKFGYSLVDHLIGAFAFVIYDRKNQKVFCVRDQIGVKPLFYYLDQNLLIVTNRKNEILKIKNTDKSPNWLYITRKIRGTTISESGTEYENIKKVKPAHFLLFEKDKIEKIKRYWSLDVDVTTRFENKSDYQEKFRELFHESVKCRLQDQDLVGAHLSGGLDSSGIVGMASNICKKIKTEFHTLSYTIPENADLTHYKYANENPLIKEQISFSEIENAHFVDTPIKFTRADIVCDEANFCDGFLASNNLATEYELHNHAQSSNINVILSGFSADELVTSFVRPYYLEYLERGEYLKYLTINISNKFEFKKRVLPLLLKVAKNLGVSNAQDKAALWYHRQFRNGQKRLNSFKEENLLSKDFIEANIDLKEAIGTQDISKYKHGFPLSLREYQRNHISRVHTSFRMESENIAGLRFGVSHRYPFSDIRLLQYVLSVPVEQKISKENARLLYRDSMSNYIIPSILKRNNKRGSLKPMNSFVKKNNISLVKLYNDLKKKQAIPFMDLDKVDGQIRNKRIPNDLSKYLLIGKLVEIGKISL